MRAEQTVFAGIVKQIKKPFELYQTNNRVNEFKWFLTSTCSTITAVVVIGFYFWQNQGATEQVQLAKIYLLIYYLQRVSDEFFVFASMYGDLLKQQSGVMNAEELATDFQTEPPTNHVLPLDWQKLEVKNLTFSYGGNGSDQPHLKNVSLTFHRGEKVAFIGETGSGKSTMMRVIRDLYRPEALVLTVDGRMITEGFGGISRAISLLPQDPEIFSTTILDNITLGGEQEIEEVRRFADMACFTEVVDRLPKGFMSSIKERGVNLSGGQKQRLALARGLLASLDKDIVLLDEATSSLDINTQMKIYDQVFQEFGDKTIISSTHSLHLLPLFDRIYMFDDGEIIGEGGFEELLVSCTEFRISWRKYQKYYREHPEEIPAEDPAGF